MLDTTENESSTALAIIPAANLPALLAADTADILGKLRAELAGYVPDATTEAGRREIGSKAKKVGIAKMDFVRLADAIKAEHQAVIKAANAELKIVEASCDAIRDGIAAPLEAFKRREKDRVAGHEAALSELELFGNIPDGWPSGHITTRIKELRESSLLARDWQEFADRALDTINATFTRLQNAHAAAIQREADAAELARLRAEKAEHDRIEAIRAQEARERLIAEEAAESARIKAEAVAAAQAKAAAERADAERREVERKAQAEREAIERREREAQHAARRAEELAAKAEKDRAEAVAKAERDRVAAVEKAERDRLAAIDAERRRVAEEVAAAKREDERRAADKAHRAAVNREVLQAIVNVGTSDTVGRAIVALIASGKIPHVTINY